MDTAPSRDFFYDTSSGVLYPLQRKLFLDRPRIDHGSIRLAGFLFCRPEDALFEEEIVPSLDYFDIRSSDNIDFFFIGFRRERNLLWGESNHDRKPTDRCEFQSPHSGRVILTQIKRSPEWFFSLDEFNSLRSDFEDCSEWRYSGGVDLLLTNLRYSDAQKMWEVVFDRAMNLHLHTLKDSEPPQSVSTLFEGIFRYAEQPRYENPVAGLSDYLAINATVPGIVDVLLSYLPQSLQPQFRRLVQYSLRDISR